MVDLRNIEFDFLPPERSYCNGCKGARNHTILHKHTEEGSEEISEHSTIWWTNDWYLLQCKGCNSIHLRHDGTHSEDYDNEGNNRTRVKYYPPAYARRMPDWLTDWRGPFAFREHPVGDILQEVYTALQNGLPRLAAMGIRAALETMMIEVNGGDLGKFERNIDAFFEQGYVATKDKAVFKEHLLEVGHAAIHRGYRPRTGDLEVIMDIVEKIVHAIYVQPFRLQNLAPIPPRPKRIETPKE